jgi:hypothetical protein
VALEQPFLLLKVKNNEQWLDDTSSSFTFFDLALTKITSFEPKHNQNAAKMHHFNYMKQHCFGVLVLIKSLILFLISAPNLLIFSIRSLIRL